MSQFFNSTSFDFTNDMQNYCSQLTDVGTSPLINQIPQNVVIYDFCVENQTLYAIDSQFQVWANPTGAAGAWTTKGGTGLTAAGFTTASTDIYGFKTWFNSSTNIVYFFVLKSKLIATGSGLKIKTGDPYLSTDGGATFANISLLIDNNLYYAGTVYQYSFYKGNVIKFIQDPSQQKVVSAGPIAGQISSNLVTPSVESSYGGPGSGSISSNNSDSLGIVYSYYIYNCVSTTVVSSNVAKLIIFLPCPSYSGGGTLTLSSASSYFAFSYLLQDIKIITMPTSTSFTAVLSYMYMNQYSSGLNSGIILYPFQSASSASMTLPTSSYITTLKSGSTYSTYIYRDMYSTPLGVGFNNGDTSAVRLQAVNIPASFQSYFDVVDSSNVICYLPPLDSTGNVPLIVGGGVNLPGSAPFSSGFAVTPTIASDSSGLGTLQTSTAYTRISFIKTDNLYNVFSFALFGPNTTYSNINNSFVNQGSSISINCPTQLSTTGSNKSVYYIPTSDNIGIVVGSLSTIYTSQYSLGTGTLISTMASTTPAVPYCPIKYQPVSWTSLKKSNFQDIMLYANGVFAIVLSSTVTLYYSTSTSYSTTTAPSGLVTSGPNPVSIKTAVQTLMSTPQNYVFLTPDKLYVLLINVSADSLYIGVNIINSPSATSYCYNSTVTPPTVTSFTSNCFQKYKSYCNFIKQYSPNFTSPTQLDSGGKYLTVFNETDPNCYCVDQTEFNNIFGTSSTDTTSTAYQIYTLLSPVYECVSPQCAIARSTKDDTIPIVNASVDCNKSISICNATVDLSQATISNSNITSSVNCSSSTSGGNSSSSGGSTSGSTSSSGGTSGTSSSSSSGGSTSASGSILSTIQNAPQAAQIAVIVGVGLLITVIVISVVVNNNQRQKQLAARARINSAIYYP